MPAEAPTTPSAAPTAAAKPARRKRGKLPLIAAAVVVLAALAGGGWWWMSRPASDAEGAEAGKDGAPAAASAKGPAIYFALDPSFVVNLADVEVVRYLQADVQLMTRDQATATALEQHAPAVRNRLLLLFGQQSAVRLAQRSAKERLQEQALVEVREALKREGAPDKVEAVLFTSLVTQ